MFNKNTGKVYSNLILWNDKRALDLCNKMNRSLFFNLLKTSCHIITKFWNSERLKAFSNYKLETNQITSKLIYQLKDLKDKFGYNELNQVLYGTIETWLIWNLSREKIFATEVTCACCTGFYDIFRVFLLSFYYKLIIEFRIINFSNLGVIFYYIYFLFREIFYLKFMKHGKS